MSNTLQCWVTVSSPRHMVTSIFFFWIYVHIPALSICSPSVLHWIPKPIIDSIHIQSLLYLLLWFGVFNYKTCRNTSKDLGHNSRTSFW